MLCAEQNSCQSPQRDPIHVALSRAARAKMSPIGLQAHAGASDEEYKDLWVDSAPAVEKLIAVK